ncbi:hypothetical protein [Legionella rowbothamii]|uniref:hypothetical protein n=1 Tax=Legionella rowbothamii TaxID=96229 RepID=UPI0010546CCF|nr:hypothetical protein [Legionella rowbothamii]
MTSLKDLVKTINENEDIGSFSKSHKTIGNSHTYRIPFASKPSQQVIAALGGPETYDDKHVLLTAKKDIKTTGNSKINVRSFTPNTPESTLTLSGKRLDRLFSSAKIYVDTSIFPPGHYRKALTEKLTEQKKLPKENNKVNWENLAVAVCHAQEIDLLVTTCVSNHGRAHTTVRPSASIHSKAPAFLLLSSPKLNLNRDHSNALKEKDEQLKFITSMYRNLFNAAVSEQREYIVMPAAGLTNHGGSPEMHFSALMAVAQEYPTLNIIYNAANHKSAFDSALKTANNPANVARTTKDIIAVADYLMNTAGKSCAIYNPSSSNVVYGLSDVGEHWQSTTLTIGTNPGKTLQAYIGTISTAPLNSYGINPGAFTNIIERNLGQLAEITQKNESSPANTIPTTSTEKADHLEKTPTPVPVNTDVSPVEQDAKEMLETHEEPVLPSPVPVTNAQPSSEQKPVPSSSVDTPVVEPIPPQRKSSSGSIGMFPPVVEEASSNNDKSAQNSSLSPEQLNEVNDAISSLFKEIHSCWPYPNKTLKQTKMDALNALITNSYTMSVTKAVEKVKNDYPAALSGHTVFGLSKAGYVSTRTRDLLEKLETADARLTVVL